MSQGFRPFLCRVPWRFGSFYIPSVLTAVKKTPAVAGGQPLSPPLGHRCHLCGPTWVESLRLEKTLQVIESNHHRNTTSPLLTHISKHDIHASHKYPQGWGLHCFPVHPVPISDSSFHEEILPHIQSKPPQAQLEAVSSFKVLWIWGLLCSFLEGPAVCTG